MRYCIFLLPLVLAWACNTQQEHPVADTAPTVAENKQQDSELTLYMRQLEKHAKQWRETALADSNITWQAGFLDTLFIATPTDGKIGDSLLFNNLGMAFSQEVQNLGTAPHLSLASQYNIMVDACVNCHRNFCPGPIKRIEKLKIPDAAGKQ